MYESLIRQFYLFESLTEEGVGQLLHSAAVAEYLPGALIFKEGDASEHFIIILEGEIEIVVALGSDVERVVAVRHAHEFLGEMSLISGEQFRTASARTCSGVQVLKIAVKDFEALLKQDSQLAYEVMRVVIQRMRATENITISDLKEKNRQLSQSLKELKEAQAQLIEKEKLEVELATARGIQASMLPASLPDLPGWRISAHWEPALAVSGDFYDVVPLPDGRIALILGDVSDKGVPAALVMTVTVSMLRAAAVTADSPGALLWQVNNLLCPQIPLGMFVTCHVSFLNPQNGEIEMASAGHCRPLLCHQKQVTEIRTQGMALGVMPDMPYAGIQARVEPGDALLLYSDGLSESSDLAGMEFGVASIRKVLAEESKSILDELMLQLHEFTGSDNGRQDDVTLLCLKRQITS